MKRNETKIFSAIMNLAMVALFVKTDKVKEVTPKWFHPLAGWLRFMGFLKVFILVTYLIMVLLFIAFIIALILGL